MRVRRSIFLGQSFWLKLIILIIAFSLGFDASFRQLLTSGGIFLLYFLLDLPIFAKLAFALRKIIAFLAGYWIFATLFGVGFPDMLLFSLQIVYFLIITVYCLGTIDIPHFIHDTRRLQRFKPAERLVYLILATSLFIRNYFLLMGEKKINRGDSIAEIFTAFAQVVKENYAHAVSVEEHIRKSFAERLTDRKFLSMDNFIGIVFLSVLVVVGAM